MTLQKACGAALAGLLTLSHAALAAGSHFAVDDARVAPAGECGSEAWSTRAQGSAHLLHAGLKCGVGPLELGAAGESSGGGGAAATTAWALQAKWAHPLTDRLSVGTAVQPWWQGTAPRGYGGTGVAFLATWTAGKTLAWHANLGRDLVRGAASLARSGIAVEWEPGSGWLLLGERFVQQHTHFLRAGTRWQGGERWSIDVSRAQRLAGPQPSDWTLGLNLEFGP